jgi:hypothetical protein
MNRQRTLAAALAAASLVALAAIPLAAGAQVRTVTRVNAVAKPKSHIGHCPATIDFVGTIHVSHYPVRVEYEWERSDGARSERRTVDIRSASRGVSDRWRLGERGERINVWERLHVLAPTGISSPEAHAHLDCR